MSHVYDNSVETLSEFRVSRTGNGGRRAMDHVLAGEHQVVPYGVRLIFHVVTTLLVMQSIVILIKYREAELLFGENGLLEWLQVIMLLLCSIILISSARQMTEISEGAYLLSFMPLIACVRELDHLLDTYVLDGAWQTIAAGLLIYMAYFALLNRAILKPQIMRILAIPPAGLLFSGFLTVMVFSRVFGQQSFWQMALQENYVRLVARIAEEGCEIFGYLLLVFGSIELLVFALSCKSYTKHKFQP